MFPKRKNLYDLFCGGGAITHCALLQNKFDHIVMNDIDNRMIQLFTDSINGKYHNETRWISRDDFFKLKDTDAYVACCWSFGNDMRSYLYSKEIEPLKKAWHYAVVFHEYDLAKEIIGIDFSKLDNFEGYSAYLESKKIIKRHNKDIGQLQSLIQLERLQSLESLERLERLQRLQSLESLERLETISTDYRNIKILPNSVIYCDIPYKDTNAYGNKNKQTFDFNTFYEWAKKQNELVMISSYEMPNDFIEIAKINHRSTICASQNKACIEKVFVPKKQIDLYNELKKKDNIQTELFL